MWFWMRPLKSALPRYFYSACSKICSNLLRLISGWPPSRGKLMPHSKDLEKATKILEIIDINLRHALKLKEYFSRAAYQDDVRAHFDNSKAAPGYSQVLDSIYFELIMTIVRMYDDLSDDKHGKNTASLPRLVQILSQADVLADLQARSIEGQTPRGKLEKQLQRQDKDFLERLRKKAIESAQADLTTLSRLLKDFEKIKGCHQLARLRSVRHQLFAHTAIVRNPNNPARYGDAEALLEKTKALVSGLNSVVKRLHCSYTDHIDIWQDHADHFWKRASGQNNE